MLVGAIVSCIGVFFHGLDSRYGFWKENFQLLCQVYKTNQLTHLSYYYQQGFVIIKIRVWFLSMGFSLGYGSLFSKVWRVHRMSSRNACDQVIS